jgi:hypothetical protein
VQREVEKIGLMTCMPGAAQEGTPDVAGLIKETT